jgi:subtilisin family serine protease
VGAPNANGQLDYLNRDLIGAQAAVFVGALNANGSAGQPSALAAYSNVAGPNTTVQNQFLVVGVEGDKTGLYGTSFAAPIVSGYAAILGSKFTKATPTQITNQLLSTARTDTVAGYNPAIHGRGEASLSRALAPSAIR